MSESGPFNRDESEESEDLARDIVSMQQGPEAAQDESHVADVAEKLEGLKDLYDRKAQRDGN